MGSWSDLEWDYLESKHLWSYIEALRCSYNERCLGAMLPTYAFREGGTALVSGSFVPVNGFTYHPNEIIWKVLYSLQSAIHLLGRSYIDYRAGDNWWLGQPLHFYQLCWTNTAILQAINEKAVIDDEPVFDRLITVPNASGLGIDYIGDPAIVGSTVIDQYGNTVDRLLKQLKYYLNCCKWSLGANIIKNKTLNFYDGINHSTQALCYQATRNAYYNESLWSNSTLVERAWIRVQSASYSNGSGFPVNIYGRKDYITPGTKKFVKSNYDPTILYLPTDSEVPTTLKSRDTKVWVLPKWESAYSLSYYSGCGFVYNQLAVLKDLGQIDIITDDSEVEIKFDMAETYPNTLFNVEANCGNPDLTKGNYFVIYKYDGDDGFNYGDWL